MKTKLVAGLIAILGIQGYAQINFEKGYFINNAGTKTECLIKNVDWKDNPTKFTYKLTADNEERSAVISMVKEFAIHNTSKYVRATVQMDRSSEQIERLTVDKNPVFKEETLFLKLLVEGKANLYHYEESNLRRLFYQVDGGEIKQLVYKKYKSTQRYQNRNIEAISTNNHYKQQIWIDVQCSEMTVKDAEKAEYRKNSLIKYFIKYNTCINPDFVMTTKGPEKDVFNLTIRPGIRLASFSVDNSVNDLRDIDFGAKASASFGIELEYVLPFNHGKWSVLLEPTYQAYKADKFIRYFQSALLTIETDVTAEYASIEIPLGIRHYFILNKDSKLFIDGGLVLSDIAIDSGIDFEDDRARDLTIESGQTGNNFFIGFGYKYKNKYSVQARYGFAKELLGPFSNWSSDYSSASIVLGYSIF